MQKTDFFFKNKNFFSSSFLFFAVFLFLYTQFFSIYFRQYNHDGPIGLGDASYYISRIAYFKEHNIFARPALFDLTDTIRNDSYECVYPYYIFYGVVSSYILGKLSVLMNVSAEQMFHLNFYIGIFFIGVVLFLLFKNINKNPLFSGIGFILFAFYSGNGCYHGFFWVVPSFYSLLFLFLNIIVFYYTKNWKWVAPFTIFLLLFSHPLSLFCIALLSFSLFIYGLLTKTIFQSFVKISIILMWFALFMGAYRYLYVNDLIFPLFAEGLNFQSLLSVKGIGIFDLINNTPFRHYFLGMFLPLTLLSIYSCLYQKEYILVSLFFSSFIGVLLFSIIHPYAFRTFLYLENLLILVFITAGFNSICFFLNHQQVFNSKNKIVRNSSILMNSFILINAFCLVLFFMKEKLTSDAGQKFQNSLFFQSDRFINYINNISRLDRIYLLNSMSNGNILLHFDSFWNKSLIKQCMLPSIIDYQDYNNAIFIGANLKMYEARRSGIGPFFPKSGKIVLKTNKLEPGKYRLTLSDTGLKKLNISNFKLGLEINPKAVEMISNSWDSNPISIKYPDDNKYPQFLPPWYYFLIRYLKKRTKEGFLIVRKTNQYFIDFTLEKPVHSIFLKNNGEHVVMNGLIELKQLPSNQTKFLLDFDWGTSNYINSHVWLLFDKNKYPILWKESNSDNKIRIDGDEIFPALYILTENFQDIKTFNLFNKQIGNNDNEE